MKEKTRRFKIRYVILGLLGAFLLAALVFMHFGGFSTGENVNPEEFLAYAEPVENIIVPKNAKINCIRRSHSRKCGISAA